MNITSSIVYYLLSKKYPICEKYRRSTNIPVKTVRQFRGGPIEEGYLYIVDCSGSIPKISGSAGCSFIFHNTNSCEIEGIGSESDTAFVECPVNGYELMEAVVEIFQELQEWDCSLKDALNDNVPLLEFMPLGRKIISKPYSIVDRDLSPVYRSPDLCEYIGGIEKLSSEKSKELLLDEEYHQAAKLEGIFLYPSFDCEERYMGINIFSGTQYIARFIQPVFKSREGLDPGQSQLFLHFAGYVRNVYLRYSGNILVRHQNDSMHNLIRGMHSGTILEDTGRIGDILQDYGWENSHEFFLIKLKFFEGTKMDTASDYICQELEKEWSCSCAVKVNNYIIWVVNLSLGQSNMHEKVFYQSLARVVQEYICKAGISSTFRSFDHLKSYCLQAETALSIGHKRHPHFWYYRFENYILDYMMAQLNNDFTGRQLCHKGLLKLVEYDRENDTEYAKTLRYYLLCWGNTTHAADKMFIHRTTFIRRMERINEISEIDLNNPDEALHLELSFRMMEREQ